MNMAPDMTAVMLASVRPRAYNRKQFAIRGMMDRTELFSELRSRGLRMTGLRMEIIDLFLDGGCGLSAREVIETVTGLPHISTVHRCLTSLEDAGFLRRDRSSDGILRYRPSRSFYPDHGHFRCRCCGIVRPLEVTLPENLLAELEKINHISIGAADIFIEGTCVGCSSNQQGSRA
jgi:Fe2+ or Zn2+ uptake regulation protein